MQETLSTTGLPPRGTGLPAPRFPVGPGLWLGLGLGGFFDGILLHQILQWHHMASSAGVPVDTIAGLKLNTLLDGLFHAATYVFVLVGIVLLWRALRSGAAMQSHRLIACILMGFGVFNLIEGLVNHQILGLHYVNETAPPPQWIAWDLGFLVSGGLLLAVGYALNRKVPA